MSYTTLGEFRPNRRVLVQALPVREHHHPRHSVRPTQSPIRWMQSLWREAVTGVLMGLSNLRSI